MRGERIQYHYKQAIIGPPAKFHLPVDVLRWRADDGPTLNAGFAALWFLGHPDQYR